MQTESQTQVILKTLDCELFEKTKKGTVKRSIFAFKINFK